MINNEEFNFITEKMMIDGLDYHYNNYIEHRESLHYYIKDMAIEKLDFNRQKFYSMRHEVVSYINRMGQFKAFADYHNKSELLPTILKFMPLRDKITAHRAIDKPRKNDNVPSVIMANNQVHGPVVALWGGNRFILQYKTDKGDLLNFDLIEEHQKIYKEALLLFNDI
ncbi:MAG: hypothetical protein JNL75_02450 [Chitinophagales bacterium]|nr:hypothetical protein [Chitinophagales bacterium]